MIGFSDHQVGFDHVPDRTPRAAGDNFAALAGPPFKPPSLPRATAAGFLGRSGFLALGFWPGASVRDRLGILL